MQQTTSFSLILIAELIGLKTTNNLNGYLFLFAACHVSPLCCPSSQRLHFLLYDYILDQLFIVCDHF